MTTTKTATTRELATFLAELSSNSHTRTCPRR